MEDRLKPPSRATYGNQLWTMLRRNLLLKRRSWKMTLAECILPCFFVVGLILLGLIMTSGTEVYHAPAVYEFKVEPFAYPGLCGNYKDNKTHFTVGVTPDTPRIRSVMNLATDYWLNMSTAQASLNQSLDQYSDQCADQCSDQCSNQCSDQCSLGSFLEVRYFADEAALVAYYRAALDYRLNNSNMTTLDGGVVFRDALANGLHYKLRLPEFMKVPDTAAPYIEKVDYAEVYSIFNRPGFNRTNIPPPIPLADAEDFSGNQAREYSQYGFSALQNVLAAAYEAEKFPNNSVRPLLLSTKLTPLAEAIAERNSAADANMPAQLFGFSCSVIVVFLVILIVTEKAKKHIASMQIMGLRPSVYWVSWTLIYFVAMFLLSISFVAICKGMPYFPNSNFLFLLIDFVLTGTSMIALGFCLAPIFRRPLVAGLLTFVLLTGINTLFFIDSLMPSLSDGARWGLALLAPTSFGMSLRREDLKTVSQFDPADIEAVPEGIRARTAIAIQGLRKTFPGVKTPAVAGFTYEIYEDEILAILGHNGAGKTTLINMLTGMLAPTSGRALVYGKDITDPGQLDVARTMIGICPQHDVLFDTFTVREHIMFYARLKGYQESGAHGEFERIIDQIGLRSHADIQSQKLSGGQKRRLSIAIACVGNPKILILDEPTSGVDPYSRRFLWDLIRGLRKGRCIIITTQSMQEADVSADRKLIMSHGELRCAGTSLFLKNRFGLGYHLTMSVDKDVNEAQVEEFVTSRVLGAWKARVHGGEISFILPKSQAATFPALFTDLDLSRDQLKVRTYGVSLTTMEEIFLRLADEIADPDSKTKTVPHTKPDYTKLANTTFAKPIKGSVSNAVKFLALCKVRLLLLLRSKLFLVLGIISPILLLILNGAVTQGISSAGSWRSAKELSIDGLTSDFRSNGPLFYSNQSEFPLEQLLRGMSSLDGTEFKFMEYSKLDPKGTPNYIGFLFNENTTQNNPIGDVDRATIIYNNSATHAIPYATNLLLNAMFRLRTGKDEIFHVSTHPLSQYDEEDSFVVQSEGGISILITIFAGLAVIMVPGIFGIDMCRDRQTKMRSQIRMTGCSFWIYWGSAFFVHLALFWVTFIIIIILMYAFSITMFTDAIGSYVVLFLLHAPAAILFSYCLSFLFKTHERATLGIPFPVTVLGYVSVGLINGLMTLNGSSGPSSSSSPEDGVPRDDEIVNTVLAFLFPFYSFFAATIYIPLAPGKKTPVDPFDWASNVPVLYVGNAVQIPLLILLIAFLESRHFNQSFRQTIGLGWLKSSAAAPASLRTTNVQTGVEATVIRVLEKAEDEDVRLERERAEGTDVRSDNTYAIILRTLLKTFSGNRRRPSKLAVNNVSMVFPKGEVFGLLGPNGAGKTTTLSMITGEVIPTSGDIHINGFNMQTETDSAIQTMGSCPQSDTIWDELTMEEHLTLFATLNDLNPTRSADSIKTFTEGLCITEHMKKKAAALSGGTKRKLTFVISMIGNPPLVLLDEPSTGMDPQSKRNLWDMIMQSFGSGDRGAILTTHSMEEADALCNRIGIIVQGRLQCVGSSQHLKGRFGSGYTLDVKLGMEADGSVGGEHAAAVEGLKHEIDAILPGAVCVEEFYNRLVFAVPKEQVKSLGVVFTQLDRVKELLNLEEYGLSQTTIEQVFMHFARMQAPEAVVVPDDLELKGQYAALHNTTPLQSQ
ncbi:ATP-binding cassette sub-family A member 5 [Hypsibius exemplaris]|uniref:ATP-binding cassette sub-family A member 5 n=1 Tax=Hypsibius exemplaris TaxID=2072580 RepID=A0A1W0W924_HYPEX|nr:ATP-binding cassette sub-family A member 5 [Hypsibius exemplaris]